MRPNDGGRIRSLHRSLWLQGRTARRFISQRSFPMAQHGYLREYDEGWDRDDDRERSDRDWRERDQEWRGDRDGNWGDRNRNFMFDSDRDRNEDRGFFSRARDE